MQNKSSETANKADGDPNDWDPKESPVEFLHREYSRLLPKIPAEFEPKGFRISFVASTDKPEYPVEISFVVVMSVTQLGQVEKRGRNPSKATMDLIDFIYKEYAKLIQREHAQQLRQQRQRQANFESETVRRSLLTFKAQRVADMVDGRLALPPGVTADMAKERAQQIAIETVRNLRDAQLEESIAPSFLSETERRLFAERCASELRSRSRLHAILDKHYENWTAGRDDYNILLQIWKLCARQATTVEAVMSEFYQGRNSRPPEDYNFERFLDAAPQLAKTFWRARATPDKARAGA